MHTNTRPLYCWSWSLAAVCVALLLTGCADPDQIEVSTVVRPDGSCDRTITQMRGYLPPEARDGESVSAGWIARWKSVAPVTKHGQPVPGQRFNKYPAITAHGTFSAPDQIPPHYNYKNSDLPGAGASELARRFIRTNFGLLVEYDWSEAVTNNVTLESYLANRDTLMDQLLPQVADSVSRSLGKKYDTTQLAHYIQHEGRAALVDASLVYYEMGALRLPREESSQRMAAVAKKHGLDWPDGSETMRRLLVQILQKNIKHRDGTAIDTAEAEKVADGQWREPGEEETEDEKSNLEMPSSPIFGLYPWFYIFNSPIHFDFTLELPGKLIETNGVILGSSQCRWQFIATDTFPAGYRMAARSIEIDEQAQRKLLDRVIVKDAADAVRFVKLVGNEGLLLKAVQEAFATGQLDPIRALNSETGETKDRARTLKTWFGIDD